MSSNPSNNSLAVEAMGMDGAGLPIGTSGRGNADSMEEDLSPYNGSKSLASAKKGFTPFFKSLACKELPQHCNHPSCFTKALTLTESYEAVTLCRVIGLLESGERGVAEFAKMSWIPQSIPCLNLRQGSAFFWGKQLSPQAWTVGNNGPGKLASPTSVSRRRRGRGVIQSCA